MPAKQPTPAPVWIGTTEAAALMSVDSRTIRTLIASGALPAYRLGSRILRIRRSDLENALQPLPTGGTDR